MADRPKNMAYKPHPFIPYELFNRGWGWSLLYWLNTLFPAMQLIVLTSWDNRFSLQCQKKVIPLEVQFLLVRTSLKSFVRITAPKNDSETISVILNSRRPKLIDYRCNVIIWDRWWLTFASYFSGRNQITWIVTAEIAQTDFQSQHWPSGKIASVAVAHLSLFLLFF